MAAKCVVIIQARFGSSRLPGKVLKDIGGATVLEHVVRRCAAIDGIDQVCCAVASDKPSDAVADLATRLGFHAIRGSEDDVLKRYHRAAVETGADVVMRVTSDCPIIDPVVCSRTLELLFSSGADYACNNMPPTWPHGLDVEVFRFTALCEMAKHATAAYEREHVTPWLRQHSDAKRVNLSGPSALETAIGTADLARLRWTLDYSEDLAFFRALFSHLPPQFFPPGDNVAGMNDFLAILAAHPEIAEINSPRADSERLGED